MTVGIDAVGIRGHGGAAVLLELLYWLPRARPEWNWRVFVLPRKHRSFDLEAPSRAVVVPIAYAANPAGRLLWLLTRVQSRPPASEVDTMLCLANAGSLWRRVPQVLFCQQSNTLFDEPGFPRSFASRLRSRLLRRLMFLSGSASRCILVQTNAMKRRFAVLAPHLSGRLRVVPSGFRTIQDPQALRPELVARIQNSSQPRLIYVAHPSEHKNHPALVRALSGIAREFPSCSLFLTLERDHPPDARYARFIAEIERTARQAAVERNITWLGILNPAEVTYVLRESTLSVFPSLCESFGLPLAESMAAGCPVAAADREYAREILGDCGLFFDPCDPCSIASGIILLLRDAGLREQMCRRGLQRARRYSYERIAGEIADLIERHSQPASLAGRIGPISEP